jgi:hypothetical protein
MNHIKTYDVFRLSCFRILSVDDQMANNETLLDNYTFKRQLDYIFSNG